MNTNIITSLICLLGTLSYSNLSYAVDATHSDSPTIPNLIYELKDIMVNKFTFIPGTTRIAINRSEEVIIVDYTKNIIIKTIPSPNPEDFISTINVSDRNNALLISTPTHAQVWDIGKHTLTASFKSKNNSRVNGLSANGQLLIFNNQIYDIKTKQSLMVFSHDASPSGYGFSKDGRYLIIAGHHSGSSVVDIKLKKQLETIKERGMQHITFTKNHQFYAGYGAKIRLEQGGYYSTSIGLYSANNSKRIRNYTPPKPISCWLVLPDENILAAQVNGTIEMLDKKLNVIKSWQLDDKVKTCAVGKNTHVWLGSQKTGLHILDTKKTDINSVLPSISDVVRLVLSEDKQYFGIHKSIASGSHINIYSLTE